MSIEKVASITKTPSSRVERDRVQNVSPNVEPNRTGNTPVILGNIPVHGDGRSGEDDAGEGDDGKDECNTKALEDLGNFHEELDHSTSFFVAPQEMSYANM
jgi:hypothetical protein